jgi:hypothetical protein
MVGKNRQNIVVLLGGSVGFLEYFQNSIIRGINLLSGKASSVFYHNRKTTSLLADRLLADTLRLAEIPSPTHREEQRAAFVLERLNALGLVSRADEEGNILVRIHFSSVIDEAPLLLFSDLGSSRWHPLESLSRLDALYARGAGLADILGTAALLSVADGFSSGRLKSCRDILLLFAAHSFDDPESKVFQHIAENPLLRPFAAIGIRGFMLGTVVTHTQGTYRISVAVSLDRKEKEDEDGGESPKAAAMVVDALISAARRLSDITWDSKGSTRLYIRRIEAGTGFGRVPTEGILEIELESSDGTLLEMAMNTVKATAESAAQGPELKTEVAITSFIPVGDPAINAELFNTMRGIMKDLHIKVKEENGSDPSAFLSHHGIPALSLGIAQGREGLSHDTIEIASIEKGRQLIEAIIERKTCELR